jgi:glutathione S-transferase
MALQLPVALMGAPGSPYTRKMLAVLRYRRIPYRFLLPTNPALVGLPEPRVRLLPTFYLPNDAGELEAVTDSTPLIRRLEAEVEGRSLVPDDPALAFLDELIEDYADEWLTKAMFHYRWNYEADIKQAGHTLTCWRGYSVPDDVLAARAAAISERQIGRIYVVGSNAVTGPVIEASYRRFLQAFEAHLAVQPFILGARPAACDFAVYGQLTQLAGFDPTPQALAAEIAPRVFAWVGMVEDLSGVEPQDGDWIAADATPPTLKALLAEMGRTYGPVMLANAAALATGQAEVRAEVEGLPWTQPPFPYQAKCLQWLRASRGALAEPDRRTADAALAGTGLEAMFA